MGEAARIYEAELPVEEALLGVVAEASGVSAVESGDRVDAQEALDALEVAAELLARADLEALDDRGLLEHTVELERQLTQIVAQRGRRLRAVDERGAYREDACVTTASWWRWRTRRDHSEASQQVRTAKRLAWLNDTREALEAGEITASHAEVIAAAAIPRRREAIMDHEPTLVSLARDATPREVAVAWRRIAELVDRDGTEAQPNAGPDQRRELYHSQTIDGLWDLRATLDRITGERLHGLLNALATPDPAAIPHEERCSPAQRRHDAFDAILRAAEEHDDLPAVHGATPHVLLTIDLRADGRGNDDTAGPRRSRHPSPAAGFGQRIESRARPRLVGTLEAHLGAHAGSVAGGGGGTHPSHPAIVATTRPAADPRPLPRAGL